MHHLNRPGLEAWCPELALHQLVAEEPRQGPLCAALVSHGGQYPLVPVMTWILVVEQSTRWAEPTGPGVAHPRKASAVISLWRMDWPAGAVSC